MLDNYLYKQYCLRWYFMEIILDFEMFVNRAMSEHLLRLSAFISFFPRCLTLVHGSLHTVRRVSQGHFALVYVLSVVVYQRPIDVDQVSLRLRSQFLLLSFVSACSRAIGWWYRCRGEAPVHRGGDGLRFTGCLPASPVHTTSLANSPRARS